MTRKVKIYAIICPITKDVKYIGKTFGTLKTRLLKHYSNIKDNSKKKKWILENIKNNIYPEIILIDEVDSILSNITEQKWILHYGIDNLLNENKGGGGCSIKGYDDYVSKYKTYLSGIYAKNTISNYISCLKIFLKSQNTTSRPKDINSKTISDYIYAINDLNSRKVALSSLKLFYKIIINQPNKINKIKYQYKIKSYGHNHSRL